MRVLMATPFPTDPNRIVGGVAGVSTYLSRQLRDGERIDVAVVAPTLETRESSELDFDGIPVRYLGIKGGWMARKMFVRRLPRLIADMADAGRYDLVHVQGITEWCRRVKIPSVFTVHGIAERDFLYRDYPWLRRALFPLVRFRQQSLRRSIENMIAISPYVTQELGSGVARNTWQIENPVRDDFFEIEYQPNPGQILYAGVISNRKNVQTLIKAFGLVQKQFPAATLRLAGSASCPSYLASCKKLVDTMKLTGSVEFLGSLDLARMQQELSKACGLVLCSFQETAPLVIEEAMAVGVPVVASDRCGMPYMIEDGRTGFLVQPERTRDVADGILRLLNHPAPNSLSERSREIASDRFRCSVVARKTASVYHEVLSNA